MAKIKFTSFIRRINRRLISLVKRFGKSSSIYQKYASEVDAAIPTDNIRFNSKGIIQLAKPKELERKGFTQDVLNQRLTVPTSTNIINKYRGQYEQYKKENKNPMSIDEFTQAIQNVRDVFDKYFDSSQILQILNEKSQEQIIDGDIFNKGMTALEHFMNQREDNTPQIKYDDFVDLAKVIDTYGL